MKFFGNYTYGLELELGDIPKNINLPTRFGNWEYSELDIVNLLDPYRYVAADPLGLLPPVGGEINLVPAKSPQSLSERVSQLLKWLRGKGYTPTSSCLSHTHVHVHVPGLIESTKYLKQLSNYVFENQTVVAEQCHLFDENLMTGSKLGRAYLKLDGARKLPAWMNDNIQTKCKDFDDFIRLHCCGKDGISRGRPFRYMINMYCLKHTETIEFRPFRGTLDVPTILNCVQFCERFIREALTTQIPVSAYISEYTFPPFYYDEEQVKGWIRTKWSSDRGKKKRIKLEAV